MSTRETDPSSTSSYWDSQESSKWLIRWWNPREQRVRFELSSSIQEEADTLSQMREWADWRIASLVIENMDKYSNHDTGTYGYSKDGADCALVFGLCDLHCIEWEDARSHAHGDALIRNDFRMKASYLRGISWYRDSSSWSRPVWWSEQWFQSQTQYRRPIVQRANDEKECEHTVFLEKVLHAQVPKGAPKVAPRRIAAVKID